MLKQTWIRDDVAPALARLIGETDPRSLSGESLPSMGGRGSLARVSLADTPFLLKSERRGGLLGKVLPDVYLDIRPFAHEWEVAGSLADLGLTPPLTARWLLSRGLLFKVWTLVVPAEGARSLLDLWRETGLSPELLSETGEFVGRLHGLGVLHGDLNVGNLLKTPGEKWLAVDLRHTGIFGSLTSEVRRSNLLRLLRSLHKSNHRFGLPLTSRWAAPLLDGYQRGYGIRDSWVPDLEEKAEGGFPLRRLLWKRS